MMVSLGIPTPDCPESHFRYGCPEDCPTQRGRLDQNIMAAIARVDRLKAYWESSHGRKWIP